MFEASDNTLVKRALKGDQKSWFRLIERYENAIFNFGIRMLGNCDDAADLMQDIFLSVYKSLDNFRGERDESFKAWLFRIGHFRCVEFYRKKHHYGSLEEAPEQECQQITPDIQSLMNSEYAHLYSAMQRLSFDHKVVVELKFFGQFTFNEIAEQLNISANTVKTRFYASLSKLRLSLEVENV